MIRVVIQKAIKTIITVRATKRVKWMMFPLLLHALPNLTKGRERPGLKK